MRRYSGLNDSTKLKGEIWKVKEVVGPDMFPIGPYLWYIFDETKDVKYPSIDAWMIRHDTGDMKVMSICRIAEGRAWTRRAAERRLRKHMNRAQSALVGKRKVDGLPHPLLTITTDGTSHGNVESDEEKIAKLADAARKGRNLLDVKI